ncbi:hypothetical protein [Silvibacterium dinghuense]|uniref:Glycosyltransferase RgtA/B/C/D-like domain-containing protein n=1 Tax=Silvibacterium dinghuense TaxID=1560006 RepID=A0A4Q1SKJ6_9BACT|nr:hypothetical protein [Silvibacterium dinghuense]RXS97989.1 hypothetical protein ESZ00_09115 [Silvibacterium dinghuense]GGH03607.1 hypothetical protein GCM10011586_19480 [Silvibacterium dinghuense]
MPQPSPIPSSSSCWSSPAFLLALFAALLAFVVQSGEIGTADTMHRLQSTHAFWTSEPPVFPNEYPEFGIHGHNGTLQSWYGIGQSLLMLPADIVGTGIAHLPVFRNYTDDPSIRNIVVSYSTSMLLAVLTALLCLRFLGQLRFTPRQAVLGTLALMLCTTHLHYTQNLMENNYIFLLTLAGFSWQLAWVEDGRRRDLLLGAAALGLNLLTRLTTGLDLLACGLFVLLVLFAKEGAGRKLFVRLLGYLRMAVPVYLFFGLLDRLYQFYRFGSFAGTYVGIVAREARLRDPSLPVTYPFEKPFHEGFFGPLFAPEKSIFLFDPLLVLMLLLIVIGWRRFDRTVRAYLLAGFALLLGYLCFYARYTVWSGDFAWGDRYVSTAVELASLLAVPLLLRHRTAFAAWIYRAGQFIVGAALVVQLVSLAFWLPLEIYQMETLGHPTFVIALRMKNIAAFALGRMQAWGLNTQAMTEDAWDYVHITTWNFFPFLLHRVGVAPAWVDHVALAVWLAALAGGIAILVRLLRLPALRSGKTA